MTTLGLLSGKEEESLIRNGFSARLLFAVEAWKTGLLRSDPVRSVWDIVIQFEPISGVFRVARHTPADGWYPLGEFKEFSRVRELLEQPYSPQIRPPESAARYFYRVTLEVERVTANDLAELQSWVGPSMNRNPATALFRGLGAIVTRLIGAQKRTYQGKSEPFRIG